MTDVTTPPAAPPPTTFSKVMTGAVERIWLSKKSTFIGLGLSISIELLNGFTDYLNTLPQGWAHGASALVLVVGAMLRDKASAAKTLAVLLALGAPFLAHAQTPAQTPAKADTIGVWAGDPTPTPSPKFGGCLTGGSLCFGPSVSISLVAVDLKSGAVTTGANPGLGYGGTWYSAKNPWLSVGFSGYATFRDTSLGQRVVVSGVFSFVEYLRLGVGQQIGPGSRPFALLGVGADLGAGR